MLENESGIYTMGTERRFASQIRTLSKPRQMPHIIGTLIMKTEVAIDFWRLTAGARTCVSGLNWQSSAFSSRRPRYDLRKKSAVRPPAVCSPIRRWSRREPFAAEAGGEILNKGGNAVDAAVATALALAVTHPPAGNLGGGGFIVLYLADEKKAKTFDFREMAPASSTATMYLDDAGKLKPGHREGPWAAGVPGTVRGLAWPTPVTASCPGRRSSNPRKSSPGMASRSIP